MTERGRPGEATETAAETAGPTAAETAGKTVDTTVAATGSSPVLPDFDALVDQIATYVVAVDDGTPAGLVAIERAAGIVARRSRDRLVRLAVVSQGYLTEPTLTAALAMAGHVLLPCSESRVSPPAEHARAVVCYPAFLRQLRAGRVDAVCLPAGHRRLLRLVRRARSRPFVVEV